jgi:hypothetical protein
MENDQISYQSWYRSTRRIEKRSSNGISVCIIPTQEMRVRETAAMRVREAAAARVREAAARVREAAARVRARGGGGYGLEWGEEEAGLARPDLGFYATPTSWPSA